MSNTQEINNMYNDLKSNEHYTLMDNQNQTIRKVKFTKKKSDSSIMEAEKAKITVLDFCKIKNISYQPINLMKNEKGKKAMVGIKMFSDDGLHNNEDIENKTKSTDYKLIPEIVKNRAEHIDKFRYMSMEVGDFIHIDVDFEDERYDKGEYDIVNEEMGMSPKEFVKQMKDVHKIPYYKSNTKKHGVHFLLNKGSIQFSENKSFNTKFGKCIEVLVGGWSWAKISRTIHNYDPDFKIDISNLLNVFVDDKYLTPKIISLCKDEGISSEEEGENDCPPTTELQQIVDNIAFKFIDDYHCWTKLVWGLRNGGKKNYKMAKAMSERSPKFDQSSFDTLWNNTKSGVTLGTINYFSRKSNEKTYFKIKAEHSEIEFLESDAKLAEIYLENSSLDHVYKDKVLYTYNRGKWNIDHQNQQLTHKIQIFCLSFIKQKMDLVNEEISKQLTLKQDTTVSKKQYEKLASICSNILSFNKASNIGKCTIINMACMDFTQIEFDKNPDLFTFKNRSVNLNTGIVQKTRRDDYILTTADYDYTPSTEKQLEELENLITQIFPDPEIKKNYIHYLATGLYGRPIEKFILANGSGGNGKGVLNELMMSTLSNYGYIAPNQLLLAPLKSGSNPEVSNMNRRRMIFYREPDATASKLCGATIKELSGGESINARMNYSNDTSVTLTATHIMECNAKPKIDTNGEALTRRLMDIPFISTFTNDPDILSKELDNVYKGNTYYKSKPFKAEFKTVLFDYLINYIIKNPNPCDNLYVCDQVRNRTKEYLQNSDELYGVISPIVEKSNDKEDYVLLKDLYKVYKSSDYYLNLSKKSKRENNLKWFQNEVASNLNYKSYYKVKHRPSINGKQTELYNILLYHKIVISENENEFIEDELN